MVPVESDIQAQHIQLQRVLESLINLVSRLQFGREIEQINLEERLFSLNSVAKITNLSETRCKKAQEMMK